MMRSFLACALMAFGACAVGVAEEPAERRKSQWAMASGMR